MKLAIILFLLSSTVWARRFPTNEAITKEGKRLYIANCIRCHNADPSKPGSIGPDLLSTPKEVFRTKVPYGTYPDGYSPKRKTKIMPKFSGLTNSVDFIYDYVRSFKK